MVLADATAIARAVRWAIRTRWIDRGRGGLASLCLAVYLWLSGVIGSEFLPHLDEGALWVRGTLAPSTGPTEGMRVANQARVLLCSFPEVTAVHQPSGASRRRHRHHRLLQHRVLRRPEAQGTMAPGLSPEQGRTDRRHGSRAGKDSRRALELLPAHRRQHGRSGQRREGRTGHQDLRR